MVGLIVELMMHRKVVHLVDMAVAVMVAQLIELMITLVVEWFDAQLIGCEINVGARFTFGLRVMCKIGVLEG